MGPRGQLFPAGSGFKGENGAEASLLPYPMGPGRREPAGGGPAGMPARAAAARPAGSHGRAAARSAAWHAYPFIPAMPWHAPGAHRCQARGYAYGPARPRCGPHANGPAPMFGAGPLAWQRGA